MIAKLTILMAVVILTLLVLRGLRTLTAKSQSRGSDPETLEPCPRCGAFVPDGRCDCDSTDTD